MNIPEVNKYTEITLFIIMLFLFIINLIKYNSPKFKHLVKNLNEIENGTKCFICKKHMNIPTFINIQRSHITCKSKNGKIDKDIFFELNAYKFAILLGIIAYILTLVTTNNLNHIASIINIVINTRFLIMIINLKKKLPNMVLSDVELRNHKLNSIIK